MTDFVKAREDVGDDGARIFYVFNERTGHTHSFETRETDDGAALVAATSSADAAELTSKG